MSNSIKMIGVGVGVGVGALFLSACAGPSGPASQGGSLAATASSASIVDGATADDGSWITGKLRNLILNTTPVEKAVKLGDNQSVPWVVGDKDSTVPDFWVVYAESTAPGCGKHLGFEVVESETAITLAAVNAPDEAGADCTASATPVAGRIVLGAPIGNRTLFHAATSPGKERSTSVLETAPGPTTPRPVAVKPYTGTATCTNLVDASTITEFKDHGWAVTGDGYTKNIAKQPDLFLSHFLKYGGIVCGWGVDETALQYAYGPITADQAEQEKKDLLSDGGKSSDEGDYEVITSPGGHNQQPTTVAFGNGYWAYGIDYGGGNVMSEVIANAPKF